VTIAIKSGERKERSGRYEGYRRALIGKESVPDDFSLLLKAIAAERLVWQKLVSVPAEWMPHQR
jgi:hypothetical protein